MLAATDHPAIVRGFGAELDGTRPHVLLEYLDGPRLSTLVRRYGIVVDPRGNSRVTETGGLPVLHLAAKEDLGGLLRWSVR